MSKCPIIYAFYICKILNIKSFEAAYDIRAMSPYLCAFQSKMTCSHDALAVVIFRTLFQMFKKLAVDVRIAVKIRHSKHPSDDFSIFSYRNLNFRRIEIQAGFIVNYMIIKHSNH